MTVNGSRVIVESPDDDISSCVEVEALVVTTLPLVEVASPGRFESLDGWSVFDWGTDCATAVETPRERSTASNRLFVGVSFMGLGVYQVQPNRPRLDLALNHGDDDRLVNLYFGWGCGETQAVLNGLRRGWAFVAE